MLRCNYVQSRLIMKFYKPVFIMMLTLWVIALCACDGRPARKKLPDFTSLQGWEDLPLAKTEKQFFFTSDTTIMEGSRLVNFLSISLPDPMYDSLAISMATSYKPLAATLIEQWSKKEKKGVLIDLRNKAGNDDRRANFLVKKNLPDNANINIPVVLIWDRASAYRADYLIKLMSSMPEIKCDLISESNKPEGIGRNDCFSPVIPSFDQQ